MFLKCTGQYCSFHRSTKVTSTFLEITDLINWYLTKQQRPLAEGSGHANLPSDRGRTSPAVAHLKVELPSRSEEGTGFAASSSTLTLILSQSWTKPGRRHKPPAVDVQSSSGIFIKALSHAHLPKPTTTTTWFQVLFGHVLGGRGDMSRHSGKTDSFKKPVFVCIVSYTHTQRCACMRFTVAAAHSVFISEIKGAGSTNVWCLKTHQRVKPLHRSASPCQKPSVQWSPRTCF